MIIIHSKLNVTFEINLCSEGEMGAKFVNSIYPIFFWCHRCYLRQVYLGSLQQYRIRWNILISNHCISDNMHINPPVNFPELTNVIFNVCNVSLDPMIDWLIGWLIDWLTEWVSECLGEWVLIDDVTACFCDYQRSQTQFIRCSIRIWVSHDISSRDIRYRYIQAN